MDFIYSKMQKRLIFTALEYTMIVLGVLFQCPKVSPFHVSKLNKNSKYYHCHNNGNITFFVINLIALPFFISALPNSSHLSSA